MYIIQFQSYNIPCFFFLLMQSWSSKRIHLLLIYKAHQWFCCKLRRRSSSSDSQLRIIKFFFLGSFLSFWWKIKTGFWLNSRTELLQIIQRWYLFSWTEEENYTQLDHGTSWDSSMTTVLFIQVQFGRKQAMEKIQLLEILILVSRFHFF